jgi:catechol 2,3-dioxygenase-like lactoylglutathione lyase family enzyme
MDVSGFDHLNLTVRDLAESKEWYGRIFRFAVVEEGVREGIRWMILRSSGGRGGAMLCLYECPGYEGADPELPGRRRVHAIRHFGLRIEDEGLWRALLRREGLAYEEVSWPHSTSWYVSDPTGYEIEVAHWKDGRVRFAPAGETSN